MKLNKEGVGLNIQSINKNTGRFATPTGFSAKCSKEQNNITILTNVAIVIEDGKILFVGKKSNALKSDKVLNANGNLATSGLVGSYTHLIFGGWRQRELEKKLEGVPYLDILKEGGGILLAVEGTRLYRLSM